MGNLLYHVLHEQRKITVKFGHTNYIGDVIKPLSNNGVLQCMRSFTFFFQYIITTQLYTIFFQMVAYGPVHIIIIIKGNIDI